MRVAGAGDDGFGVQRLDYKVQRSGFRVTKGLDLEGTGIRSTSWDHHHRDQQDHDYCIGGLSDGHDSE